MTVAPQQQSADKTCKLKEAKAKKSLIDRTLLNNLIRKSMDKKFVQKYLGKYIGTTSGSSDEKELKKSQCIDSLNVRMNRMNTYCEKQDNVMLINEVKSNTESVCVEPSGSIRVEKAAFLSLDNCKEINLNDGNSFFFSYVVGRFKIVRNQLILF